MPLTMAVANLKGGVGKSTAVVCLAESLALHQNLRVLVIDLDPQSNASFMLLSRDGVENAEALGKTFPNFLLDLTRGRDGSPFIASYVCGRASDLTELAAGTRGRVDIMPSVPRLWFVEMALEKRLYLQDLDPANELKLALAQHLRPLRAEYDLFILDCPPGFSALTRSGLLCADVILSPTIADAVSVRSLADFVNFGLGEVLKLREVPHFVMISKYQNNETAQIEKDRLKRRYNVLEPSIRYSVDMTRAMERIRHDSFRTFARKYRGLATDVRSLADRVYQRIILQHGANA
jgi:cellulose biosynthesis protein BcsQ